MVPPPDGALHGYWCHIASEIVAFDYLGAPLLQLSLGLNPFPITHQSGYP